MKPLHLAHATLTVLLFGTGWHHRPPREVVPMFRPTRYTRRRAGTRELVYVSSSTALLVQTYICIQSTRKLLPKRYYCGSYGMKTTSAPTYIHIMHTGTKHFAEMEEVDRLYCHSGFA